MAGPVKADGQDKVIAAAQHIVQSLATSKNSAEDMIRILSGFDYRLSELAPPAAAVDLPEDAPVRTKTDLRLEVAEQVIYRWDASDSLLFEDTAGETTHYLASIDEVASLALDDTCSRAVRSRAETAIQVAMARLEDEFRHLMIRNTVPLDPQNLLGPGPRPSLSFASDSCEPSNIDDFESSAEDDGQHHHDGENPDSTPPELVRRRGPAELIHPEALADLKAIADRMIVSGYGKELCQVYSTVRRDILDECLSILGVDRMSIDEVQRMEWQMLDDRMRKWIQAIEVGVGTLFPSERQVCEHILAESPDLCDESFTEATKGCIMQLLNFGDAVAVCRRSSEKLFRILGMYEALAGVMTDLAALFQGDSGELIISEAEGILCRLGDAARGTLNEFGNAVQKETSRKPMQGGEIHPLTRYVMNYVKLLVDYKDSLDLLLDVIGPDGGGDNDEGEEHAENKDLGSMSPTGRRLLDFISYLEVNLEEKSKLYEDGGGMQCVFMMNNIHYIVQKVKDSELGALLGSNWVRRRRGQVRQYATSYLRNSWTRALSFLKDDGLGGSGSANIASRMALKDRFKNFNLAFEEIYRNQTSWRVPDPQLREELRISISEKVIPAYRSFLGRFGGHLEGGRHAAKYIKYTPEDLENYLLDLFEGLPGGGGPPSHLRRKLSS